MLPARIAARSASATGPLENLERVTGHVCLPSGPCALDSNGVKQESPSSEPAVQFLPSLRLVDDVYCNVQHADPFPS